MIAIVITRDDLAEVISAWREEWDASPHQFLASEQFRQADAASYASAVADHLFVKLLSISPISVAHD